VVCTWSWLYSLRQTPVQHNDFAEGPHDDVLTLEIAVDEAARVGISDRIANSDKGSQQFDQPHRVGFTSCPGFVAATSRLAQRTPLHKPHGVIGQVPFAHFVDRNDSWVFELRGYPGFGHEPGTDHRVIHLVGTQLFEGDLAAQGRVMSKPDLPHTSLGIKVGQRVAFAVLWFLRVERPDQDGARWRAGRC